MRKFPRGDSDYLSWNDVCGFVWRKFIGVGGVGVNFSCENVRDDCLGLGPDVHARLQVSKCSGYDFCHPG